MGNTYNNILVKGAEYAPVIAILTELGATACIGVLPGEYIGVWQDSNNEAVSDDALALLFSERLNCTAWAVSVYDDDVLYYTLCREGRQTDAYNSTPGYGSDSGEFIPPSGGNVASLCAAFGAPEKAAEVDAILHTTEPLAYIFASDRHRELLVALGLPDAVGGTRYEDIESGEADMETDDGILQMTRLEGKELKQAQTIVFVQTPPDLDFFSDVFEPLFVNLDPQFPWPMGEQAEVRAALTQALPELGVMHGPTAVVQLGDVLLEADCGSEATVNKVMLTVRGASDWMDYARRVCAKTRWRAFSLGSMDFLI